MNKNIDYTHTVMDDDGYTWYWDGSRVYVLGEERPDSEDIIDEFLMGKRGYKANTWEDAIHLLVVDGYISEEEEEWQTRPTNSTEYKDWFDPKESYLPDY
jgi:hypothetical protein